MWLVADDAISRLPSVQVEFRMKECGRATRGVSQAEGLTRQSVIPSGASSAAINLQLRSPHVTGDTRGTGLREMSLPLSTICLPSFEAVRFYIVIHGCNANNRGTALFQEESVLIIIFERIESTLSH